ncbi:MAG: GntR family transcriptional regulator [Nitriliruptoraceae bacterium]
MSRSTALASLTVDAGGETPPYAQIRDAIAGCAARGELRPGDRLPTVRALAVQLDVAPNTVARAYRELEQAGMVETRGRHGTFLALDTDRVHREGFRAACAYVDRAVELGLDGDDIRDLVERAIDRGGAG